MNQLDAHVHLMFFSMPHEEGELQYDFFEFFADDQNLSYKKQDLIRYHY